MAFGQDAFHCEVSEKREWMDALAAEDCLLVYKLLEKNKNLLNEGWEESETEEVGDWVRLGKLLERVDEHLRRELKEDSKLLNKRSLKEDAEAAQQLEPRRVWKGRTALHVAVRRGHAELIEKIRDILHPGVCPTWQYCRVLEVIDTDYELDALAMAVVNGNRNVVNLVKKIGRDCNLSPYPIRYDLTAQEAEENQADSQLREAVKSITVKVLIDYSGRMPFCSLEEMYEVDCDFNFLPINLFLFHFTFSTWPSNEDLEPKMREIRNEFYRATVKPEVREFLLSKLYDGQGRTPLHVAVDSNKVQEFLYMSTLLSTALSTAGETDNQYILNDMDSAGRTPLYRAAAKNQVEAVDQLLGKVNESNVNILDTEIMLSAYKWGEDLDIDKLSWRNTFKSDCIYIPEAKLQRKSFNNKSNAQGGPGPANIIPLTNVSSTALHAAIILKHEDVVEKLVKKLCQLPDGHIERCKRLFTWPIIGAERDQDKCAMRNLKTMKLAVLVGCLPILQKLLEAEEKKPGLFTSPADEADLSSFHLAAAMGNPEIIRAFLDSDKGQFDPGTSDCYKNTALHHALKGKYVKFHPHLVDFVGCNHVFAWRWENCSWISEWLANPQEEAQVQRTVVKDDNAERNFDRYAQRRGSINLLLEAGIYIWEPNQSSRIPSPGPDAPAEFVRWWYEKVSQEIQQLQNTLNAAANAISLTATLVATASYMGPSQPPLGFPGNSINVNLLAVRIFIVCDSLSFYFALAAIMLALLPSLPLPRSSMFREVVPVPQASTCRELVRTRVLVAVAMTFLFPSIVCVLGAFAAGYFAVIPHQSFVHHGFSLGPTVVGGILCFGVMIAFLRRLLKVFYYSVYRDIVRVLKEVSRETVRVLKDVRRETVRVLRDIRRETVRVLRDIRRMICSTELYITLCGIFSRTGTGLRKFLCGVGTGLRRISRDFVLYQNQNGDGDYK